VPYWDSSAKLLANYIKRYNEVKIVTHIDADGLCAGALANFALTTLNIENFVEYVSQLDNITIEKLKNDNSELYWFTDLGSSNISKLKGMNAVITDHHIQEKPENNEILQLNPHIFGKDGSLWLSGAGATYLVCKDLTPEINKLAHIPIVGAVGDLQDDKYKKLIGMNREILMETRKLGLVDYFVDLRIFGKETKPVYKLLEYANDPILPQLTGNENKCITFLHELDIPLRCDDKWRKWIDLSFEEKRKIVSELVYLMLCNGVDVDYVKRLVGECYILLNEQDGSELHDAKEFATLLNACGRYGYYEIGNKICLGNRDIELHKAQNILQGHRKSLSDAVKYVFDTGISQHKTIQYFHAHNFINDKIVGIVASMVLPFINKLPIIAFANSENGVKVSARIPRKFVDCNINLGKIIAIAAEKVNGSGGGHSVAAGALIPEGTEKQFLDMVDDLINQSQNVNCNFR